MTRADAAHALHVAGCACSQAVFGAFAPDHGLDQDVAIRLSAGFAGGMRRAGTCGAVTGAIMALSLARCPAGCRSADCRAATYEAVQQFYAAFEARHGVLACRDLLGHDISTPEGMEAAKAENLFELRCRGFVRDAAGIVEQLLAPRLDENRETG